MITLLSPAKTLHSEVEKTRNVTTPIFEKQTEAIVKKLQTLSKPKLKALMSISDDLTRLNRERYQNFVFPLADADAGAAIHTFAGDAYRGLDAATLSDGDLDFAQDHLRILSGLYGLLKPMDNMQPYRLEMGTRLPLRRKKNLYDFWGSALTDALNSELEGHKNQSIINLASKEYFSAIREDALIGQVYHIHFKEYRDGILRNIQFNMKRARGLMTRFIMQHRIDEPESIKAFDTEDYFFDKDLSTDNEFVFTR